MKLISFCSVFLVLFSFSFESIADQISYNASIKPLLIDEIKYGTNQGYRGMISDIREIGDYVFPEVTNSKGEVIKPASLLVSLDTGYWNSLVEAAKMAVISAEISMNVAKLNYERTQNLVKSNSISQEACDDQEATYYQALNSYITAKATLYQQQKQLDFCKIYSSMCGIVTNRFIDVGEDPGGEPVVIEVTQLSPIGIAVELKQEVVSKLGNDDIITIKDINGVLYEFNFELIHFDGKTATLKIPNYMIYGTEIEIEGVKYPVVDSYSCVSLFSINQNDTELAVPIKAIFKDDTGEYVWLAKKNKDIDGLNGSTLLSEVIKVNVITADEITIRDGNKKIVKLKNQGILKPNDLVLTGWNSEPKQGQKAILVKNRYNFMPADNVSITITH